MVGGRGRHSGGQGKLPLRDTSSNSAASCGQQRLHGRVGEEEMSGACRRPARHNGPLGSIYRPPCFTLTSGLGHWWTHALPQASLALSSASTGSQGRRGQEERGGECGQCLLSVHAEVAPHT